jgi:hypothetical protein
MAAIHMSWPPTGRPSRRSWARNEPNVLADVRRREVDGLLRPAVEGDAQAVRSSDREPTNPVRAVTQGQG